jgi:hypothetical protein
VSPGLQLLTIGVLVILAGLALPFITWRFVKTTRARVLVITAGAVCVLTGVIFSLLALTLPARMARDAANSRIKILAHALLTYADEYDAFPPDLLALVPDGYATPRSLRSIYTGGGETGCDYVYVANLPADPPPDWPLVFDADWVHADGTRAVCFVSGEVAVLDRDAFTAWKSDFEASFEKSQGQPPHYLSHPRH